jgi:hypothetical protein
VSDPLAADVLPRARALLHELAGPHGLHASAATTANYRAIFARDAVMAGIAGLLLEDPVISGGLVRSLALLRDTQGPAGQVASNVAPRDAAAPAVSYGTLVPRLDSASWYVLGAALAVQAGAVPAAAHREAVARAIALLDALEYNGRHLLYVPAGGNWADEYVTEGYTLVDQALRAWALDHAARAFDVPGWAAKSAAIGAVVTERFAPDAGEPPHPMAAVAPTRRQGMFDLAGCTLLALSGRAPALAEPALDWIDAHFLAHGTLPPVFHPVIAPGDADWDALTHYHLHGFRNAPHEYHNGGIWPIWLGWLGVALAQRGRRDAVERLTRAVGLALDRAAPFDFEEYLHGQSGRPLGTPRMAYSATGLWLLALAAREAPALDRLRTA